MDPATMAFRDSHALHRMGAAAARRRDRERDCRHRQGGGARLGCLSGDADALAQWTRRRMDASWRERGRA